MDHPQSHTSLSLMILKLIVLLVLNVLVTKAFTPPNKEQHSDKVDKSTMMNRYARLMAKYINIPFNLLPSVVMCFIILSRTLSSASLLPETVFASDICPRDVTHELDRLSPLFIGIFFLIVGGSYLRLLCFRELGKLFTFHVTIRPNHRIVDSGPYGIVRHPSYTGLYLIATGLILWILCPQNPFITCGWAESSLVVAGATVLWLLYLLYALYGLAERIPIEERNLQIHFGQEWDSYVERVPYKFIPRIF